MKKALIYNSVSIFTLIENVEYITYHFSGQTYTIKKTDIINDYPNYKQVIQNNKINILHFNQYVENQMNNDDFVLEIFNKLF